MKKILFAAAAVVSLGAFAAVPFKIGIAGYTFHKKNVDQTIEAMKELDLHSLCVKDFHLKLDCTQEEADAFKAKLAEAGIVPVGVGPIYADTEEVARKGFEQAKKLGVRVVVGVPFEWSEIDGKKTRVESDKMLDIIDRLVKEYDMVYAIHNHGPDIPYLFPTAEAAIKRIGNRDKRIGVCLDIGHERRAGLDPVKFIEQNSDRIYDVHLKNIKIDPVKNLAMRGPRGELDIPAIFAALAKAGYSGNCNIEYERDFDDNMAGLLESVGYYRGVADTIKVKAKMKPAPEGANTLTAAEKAEGWKLAWDGKTLDGWLAVKSGCKAPPEKGWVIKDGTLTMRPVNGIANGNWFPLPPEDQKLGGGGDIVTAKKYRDFAFKFDFRLTENANSGVKYFYDETLNKGTCEEYQVLENGHPDSDKGKDGNRKSASLYDIIPANADSILKGPGEWNSGMIVSKGAHVEHWLNGVKVLEYDRGTPAFKASVKASKYADWGIDAAGKPQDWGEIPEGRILLQDHSDSTVSFCNLKVKEL
ncbi:MAG: DUF1080 domain-containing protein [Kiritimatiellae bacterium]|nr:DUF1080 domain-containing protein [Kiritimatiellia bacterium]